MQIKTHSKIIKIMLKLLIRKPYSYAHATLSIVHVLFAIKMQKCIVRDILFKYRRNKFNKTKFL